MIKKINEYGSEYWSARDLMSPLGYTEWRNFDAVVQKAKKSCASSGQPTDDHFVDVNKMVSVRSEAS